MAEVAIYRTTRNCGCTRWSTALHWSLFFFFSPPEVSFSLRYSLRNVKPIRLSVQFISAFLLLSVCLVFLSLLSVFAPRPVPDYISILLALLLVFASFYARQRSYSAYMPWQFRLSVCPSVRPSHGWISQKRLKLGSRNFHHTVTVAPSL